MPLGVGQVLGALVIGLVGCGVCRPALGQDARPPAEKPPAPAAATRQVRPNETYDPLHAGQDAYQLGEQQRRRAINRQLWLWDEIKRYNTWIGCYAPSLPEIYAYGSPRAARRASRYGFGPLFTPWPLVPGDVYGYPYYPWVKQPIGHEKIWTGPNSYIYLPRYAPPANAQGTPARAAPAPTPATVPQPPPRGAPPANLAPERIPTPPVESGPREF